MSAISENEDRPLQSEEDESDPLLAEFKRLKKEITDAQRARGDWYNEAERCYDFVAGHQWDPEDKAKLDEENRPAVVFNRIEPLINAVAGLEVNNRQGVVYLGRKQGDNGPNEMITATGKWVRDECHAEDEESEAFRDLTICGEGWTETRMDFDEEPTGKIVKERISALEMGVNRGAVRANYADARLVYRIREMDPDDVRALLGLEDFEDAALDAKWLDKITPEDGGIGNKKDYPDKTPARVRASGRGFKLKTVKVVQCQYWKREPVNLVATPNDQEPQEMNDEDFKVFKNRAAQSMLTQNPIEYEHARTTRKRYYECFLGIRILGDVRPMKINQFQFQAMTGNRDRKKKCFYGMVRGMMDPAMWANKFFSQTMHHINVNAKGGLIAETDAFVNVKNAERDWADPTKIVWVKPGSLTKQKVKERTAIALPPGLEQLMLFAISSIRDVTGINLELLGQADREQAAILEQQRRQSAMTILATMFDSLRKYRKRDGRLTLHFIKLLPEGTLVRVVEQGQIQYIPLVKKDLDFEKFEVIIDQAPSSPDQKQYIWAVTAQILQMNILPPPAIIALLKYSPYPESVVQEIQNALGLNGELPPDQLKQKLQQAEEALQLLEGQLKDTMEKLKEATDDRSIEMLKIEIEEKSQQIDEYRAETERLKEQWAARIKAAGDIAESIGGEAVSREVGLSSVVNTGQQELPSGEAAAPSGLEQKVDALAALVSQLVQTLSPPQQEMVPPDAGQMQEEPPAQGEV